MAFQTAKENSLTPFLTNLWRKVKGNSLLDLINWRCFRGAHKCKVFRMRLQSFWRLKILITRMEVLNNEAIWSFSSWASLETAAIYNCSQFEGEGSGVVAARKGEWMDSISSCTRICTLFHCRSGMLSRCTSHSPSGTAPRRGHEFEDHPYYRGKPQRHTCSICWARSRCGCCRKIPMWRRATRWRNVHSETLKQRLVRWRIKMFLLLGSSFRNSLSICTTHILGGSSCPAAAAGLA